MGRAALILAAATASALSAAYAARSLSDAQDPTGAEPVAQVASLTEVDNRPAGPGASVRKAADGHYWAQAQVQGRHVKFLVDTGASTVALTGADAKRLGMHPQELTFDVPVETAGGRAMAARITLDYVSVAGARIEDVEAVVMQDGLETSLLGMTYLGRLSRFEATKDALILRR